MIEVCKVLKFRR